MMSMKTKLTLGVISLILSLSFPAVSQAQTVLEDIRQTGVLKVGIRQDAPPFGFLENAKWKGVCLEGAELLRASLEQELKRPIKLEKQVTTLDENSANGRHRSITSNRVHLECGPNTIRKNTPPGITYSIPFFFTGTYFLVKPMNRLTVNPSGFLQNVVIGVLDNTLTQDFLGSRYQLAPQKVYRENTGREQAIKDAVDGKIDAFASDGVLLVGEALLLGLKESQYSIIPEQPLTCVSYGLLLPAKDAKWEETVNNFIRNRPTIEMLQKVYGPNSPFIPMSIIAADRCI